MSLSVDGVWKTGVWDQTVWADGVWREGDYLTSGVGTGGRHKKPLRNYYTRKELEDLLLQEALEEEVLETGSPQEKREAKNNLRDIRAALLRQKPAIDRIREDTEQQRVIHLKREKRQRNARKLLELDKQQRSELIKLWINI